jgi:hypothetical protein
MAPSRIDIDPLELPPELLRHLFMLDVVDGGADFRYRLIGSDLVEGVGRDATGALVSEIYRDVPASLAAMNRFLRQTTTDKLPVYIEGEMDWLRGGRQRRPFRAVMLPLSADNLSVDIVLGGLWVVDDSVDAGRPSGVGAAPPSGEIHYNGMIISRDAFIHVAISELGLSRAEATKMFDGLRAKLHGRWGTA